MHRAHLLVIVLGLTFAGCSPGGTATGDAAAPSFDAAADTAQDGGGGSADAGAEGSDDAAAGTPDAGASCQVSGAPGDCESVGACAALGEHTSTPGLCPGPADIQCCTRTPNVADNPPTPAGYRLMMQSEVTPDMTTWAVAILHDPVTYPMFSTTTMTFGTLDVLARVEWHPPDVLNMVVHRGVTLYLPLP